MLRSGLLNPRAGQLSWKNQGFIHVSRPSNPSFVYFHKSITHEHYFNSYDSLPQQVRVYSLVIYFKHSSIQERNTIASEFLWLSLGAFPKLSKVVSIPILVPFISGEEIRGTMWLHAKQCTGLWISISIWFHVQH